MTTIITLVILNLIAMYYAYSSGKKRKEDETLINYNSNNNKSRRIGDLEEIKRRLNNNEF